MTAGTSLSLATLLTDVARGEDSVVADGLPLSNAAREWVIGAILVSFVSGGWEEPRGRLSNASPVNGESAIVCVRCVSTTVAVESRLASGCEKAVAIVCRRSLIDVVSCMRCLNSCDVLGHISRNVSPEASRARGGSFKCALEDSTETDGVSVCTGDSRSVVEGEPDLITTGWTGIWVDITGTGVSKIGGHPRVDGRGLKDRCR